MNASTQPFTVVIHVCPWGKVCTSQSRSQQTALIRQTHAKVHCKEPAEAVCLRAAVGDAYHILICSECQGDAPDIAMSTSAIHGNGGRL